MKQNLYHPFEIIYKEIDECSKPAYSQNFFELVYILDGNGIQYINNNTFDYSSGHLLLITPKDLNSFEVRSKTKFLFILFNNMYIESEFLNSGSDFSKNQWIKRLEFILHNASNIPGCILHKEINKKLVRSLVESIIVEYRCTHIYSQELLQQLVNSLIILVARSISDNLPDQLSPITDQRLFSVFKYIHDKIYYPDLLKVSVICASFGFSPHYFGKFFKRHTGDTLQEYILKYKIKIIETRLLNSDMRINEIVSEFQFSDISHLNRVFKKYNGVSPSVFKKIKRN